MKKTISIILATCLVLGIFAGCSTKSSGGTAEAPASAAPDSSASADSASDKSALKIAMVTDIAGINDQAFCQSSWEGMQKTEKDFGVKISYKESSQNADYVPNLETMYDEQNDLIWGVGFAMSDAVMQAAQQNPDQKYAIIDAGDWETTPDNLLGILFKAEDSGFLVGYIAGRMTKTNKIGFVGGMSIPSLWQFECGFRAGVAYANPEAEVTVQYAESFTDVAKGKSIANGMFVQDVDIIFHAAAGLGDGVIEAAKEQDKWVIGVDRDQNYLAPDNVLTSAMKRVDTALYNVNKDLIDGVWNGGTTVVYGLKEGAVGIAPTSEKNVPADILADEAKVEEKIIGGEIVAPGNYEALDQYLASLKQ